MSSYASAGVNLDRYNRALKKIVPGIRRTYDKGVLKLPGGFAGLYSLAGKRGVRNPVLVACTDGVGTKLKIAIMAGKHDTVGIDLVAMSVNDMIVTGARPLFFLDYYATGKLKTKVFQDVVRGITLGCKQADCALLGGETAEMPGMYRNGDHDLAGFAVGIVDGPDIIDGSKVRKGDVVIGLPSNGLHSNGYSLVRKIVGKRSLKTRVTELGGPLGKTLLTPTRIYVRPILQLLRTHKKAVRAMAHITGGGLVENLPRVLPRGLGVELFEGSWGIPPIFGYLQRLGRVSKGEMNRVFNMGIGLALIVAPRQADGVLRALRRTGEKPVRIGRIVKGTQGVRFVPASE